MQPTLTIITVVNDENTLIDACLHNVVEQNCPTAEHLIIDLTPTRIAESPVGDIAQILPNIIYLSKINTTLREGLNHAVSIANGKLIGFLSTRSMYVPHILKRIAKLAAGLSNPSLLVGNCKMVSDSGEIIHVNKPQQLKYTDVLAGRAYPYYPVSYFYHRSLHDTIGVYNHDDEQLAHLDFLLRVIRTTPVHYYDEPWGIHISAQPIFATVKMVIDEKNMPLIKTYTQQLSPLPKLKVAAKKFSDKLSTSAY